MKLSEYITSDNATFHQRVVKVAVLRERLRVARYLHHLLGANLSAIAFESDLICRMLPDAPCMAKGAAGEVLRIARQLLADVRMVASGYRAKSFLAEAETTLAMMRSAGIDTYYHATRTALPPETCTVLAITLREAVHNVLRHSEATWCRIELAAVHETVHLHVANDGVRCTTASTAASRSHGLDNLRSRLEAVGGRLSAGPDGKGSFHVRAEVPLEGAPDLTQIGPRYSARLPVLEKWAPRVTLALTLLTLGVGGAALLAQQVLSHDVATVGFVGLVLCFALVVSGQIVHSTPLVRHWPLRARSLTLSAQAAVTYLPLLWIGAPWAAMVGFLSGAVLLALRSRIRWLLFAAVAATAIPVLGMTGVAPVTLSVGVLGLAASTVQALIFDARAARQTLVRVAIAQERLRVAQDLHDLLGYRLSAITLKTELAYRLLPDSPDRARELLAEVLTAARQALVDMYGAATGSRSITLVAEAESALATLSAADIDASVDIFCGPLPRQVETVLAIVLRESVTNVLRHSKARECQVEVVEEAGWVRLHVANDGMDSLNDGQSGTGGTGLRNLQARLEGVGGRFSAGLDGAGWFHVVAEAPMVKTQP
jgi:signal transduction histidine kinase